jgi:hypothetical protein
MIFSRRGGHSRGAVSHVGRGGTLFGGTLEPTGDVCMMAICKIARV